MMIRCVLVGLLLLSAMPAWLRSAEPSADGKGVFGAYAVSKDYTPPRDPAVLCKLARWQEQKFGLMITWGAYSQWGIVESWSLCPERYEWNRRPGPYANDDLAYKRAYENLITTFNPVKFDPHKWAAAAKEAGLKYMLVMAKHHDGFCMYDSAQTDYKITSARCPFHTDKRADVTKAISTAFREEGFSVGVYFSKSDWNCPYYWSPDFPLRNRNNNYDTRKSPELWKKFKEFTWRQIAELMTGYGPIDILWLDGGQVRPPNQDIDMRGMAAMARRHQPGLIVVDRTVRGEYQNYLTPEQEIPGKLLPYPWETCMTMGTSWSYKPNDRYKSAGTLIRNLCRIVARGGNYLVNFGVDAHGEPDPVVYDRFKEIGAWMKVNGEAIYDTHPVKPYELGALAFTGKADGTVYAILLAKDDAGAVPDRVEIPAELAGKAGGITLLGYGAIKPGETKDGLTRISIPAAARAKPPCAYAWAFKLR
jgi:alpha-L-fucosidase